MTAGGEECGVVVVVVVVVVMVRSGVTKGDEG